MEQQLYDRLMALWDGRAEFVMDGGNTYRVLLPDGKEHPVFSGLSDTSAYGSTSTELLAPEPKSKKTNPKSAQPRKINKKFSDTGG